MLFPMAGGSGKGVALRKGEKDKGKPSLGASVIIIYYLGTLLKLTRTQKPSFIGSH